MTRRHLFVARRHERSARGEQGVILIETAVCITFLMGLLVATFELGMGWRTSITNSNAARAGARVEAYQGIGYQADYAALISISSALTSVSRATITKVIVFKATSGSSTVPSTCLAVTPSNGSSAPSGVVGSCNVYSATQVAGVAAGTIASSKFGAGTNVNGACTSSALDYDWCPNGRSNSQAAGLDNVGVYVQLTTLTYTKLFGSSFTITDTEIMQIEPSTNGS